MVFVERASSYVDGTFEQMMSGPHLAWDPASGSVIAYSDSRGKLSADSAAPSSSTRRFAEAQ